MARYIPGPMITAIKGSIGQATFTTCPNTGVIKKKGKPVRGKDAVTAKGVSRYWAEILRDWYGKLTPEQRTDWARYASAQTGTDFVSPKEDRKGPWDYSWGDFTGYEEYTRTNARLVSAGYEAVTDAPSDKRLISTGSGLFGSYSPDPTPAIKLTWGYIYDPSEDVKLVIKAKGARHSHEQIVGVYDLTQGVALVESVRGKEGGDVGLPKDWYHLSWYIIRKDGKMRNLTTSWHLPPVEVR